MVNLDAQRQKIETLNSADNWVIDTIAGALLRIFVRLEQTDADLRLHRQRIRVLERGPLPADRTVDGPKAAATTTRQHRAPHRWSKVGNGSGATHNSAGQS